MLSQQLCTTIFSGGKSLAIMAYSAYNTCSAVSVPYYPYNDPSNKDVLASVMKLVPKSNFYLLLETNQS